MSTERRTDRGDYVLVEIGEPTVESPTVGYASHVEWKVGTEQANLAALTEQAATSVERLVAARISLAGVRAALDAVKTSAQAVADKANNQLTAGDTKALARAIVDVVNGLDTVTAEERRIAREVLALARLAGGRTESADTGTE